jgi:5-methylcytosine-specific restriction enzyme subunit McrC
MEKIFENFVAAKLRKHIKGNIRLRTQDSRYSLFDYPARAFSLRPDLVLESEERTFILDTKWKLLSDAAQNKGISQADMYQMYVYSKKYNAGNVVLLYPYSDYISGHGMQYASNDNVNVRVSFVDLRNSDDSIKDLLTNLLQPKPQELTSFYGGADEDRQQFRSL